MPAKFVMLPSQTGSFIVDAHRVISARESPLGTIITTAERIDLEVFTSLETVLSILGTLRFQANAGGVAAWFNHRYLDFASLNDAGPTILSFGGGSGVQTDAVPAETLVELLARLEGEMDQR